MSKKRSGKRASGLFAAVLGIVAISIGQAAADQATEGPDSAAASKGEGYFRTYCSSCHGRTAMGDGPLAKDLKAAPADLTRLSERNGGEFPIDMVIQTIQHGRSVRGHGTEAMPAWGDAFKMTTESDEDAKRMMNDLAHYLWRVQSVPFR